MRDAGRAPYRAANLKYTYYTAQVGENKITTMQEMRCRKRNIDTHTSGNLVLERVRSKTLGRAGWNQTLRPSTGPDKRSRAEQRRGPGQGGRDTEWLAGICIGR